MGLAACGTGDVLSTSFLSRLLSSFHPRIDHSLMGVGGGYIRKEMRAINCPSCVIPCIHTPYYYHHSSFLIFYKTYNNRKGT